MTPRSIAGAGLFVMVCAGVAGGQIVAEPASRTKYLNCGGFTVTAGHMVLVHATLDDLPDGRPARAKLQLLDEIGSVKAQKEQLLQAGQSTTLVMTVAEPGATVLRAHVEFKEAALPVSAQRAFISLVEGLDLTGVIRTICVPIDNGVRPPPQ